MVRIDYTTRNNTIGHSVKYPDGINRKWSESHKEISCENCSGKNISSDITGDIVTIVCHDCPSYCHCSKDSVFKMHDSQEAYLNLSNTPFSRY